MPDYLHCSTKQPDQSSVAQLRDFAGLMAAGPYQNSHLGSLHLCVCRHLHLGCAVLEKRLGFDWHSLAECAGIARLEFEHRSLEQRAFLRRQRAECSRDCGQHSL